MGRRTRTTTAHTPAGAPPAQDGTGERVDPTTLTPWARNPRVIREAAVTTLGWGRPILARPSDRVIIAGHRAHAAALYLRAQGRPVEVPVWWRECTDDELARLAVADNGHAEQGLERLAAIGRAVVVHLKGEYRQAIQQTTPALVLEELRRREDEARSVANSRALRVGRLMLGLAEEVTRG